MASFQDLVAEVANTSKVTDSVVVFITGLGEQLKIAQANSTDPAAFDAVINDLKANETRLTAAIAPPPAAPPEVVPPQPVPAETLPADAPVA